MAKTHYCVRYHTQPLDLSLHRNRNAHYLSPKETGVGDSLAPSLWVCLCCDTQGGHVCFKPAHAGTQSAAGAALNPAHLPAGCTPQHPLDTGAISAEPRTRRLRLRISDELNRFHTHCLNWIIAINYTGLNSGHALSGSWEMLLLQAAAAALAERRGWRLHAPRYARSQGMPTGRGRPRAKQQLTTACLSCAKKTEGNLRMNGDSSHGFLQILSYRFWCSVR